MNLETEEEFLRAIGEVARIPRDLLKIIWEYRRQPELVPLRVHSAVDTEKTFTSITQPEIHNGQPVVQSRTFLGLGEKEWIRILGKLWIIVVMLAFLINHFYW